MNSLRVLYEDNHVLAVVKPAGVPVQEDETRAPDLLNQAKQYIKERYGKPGEVYLGMVHRLDRPVGGIVVFARTSKAAARLSAQIADRAWDKTYFAIVEGAPPDEGTAIDWLLRDEPTRLTHVVAEGDKTAKRAELSWRVLDRRDGLSLVQIALVTGRHHQIRVQMASRGWPIWADARYGTARADDIALWAASVGFWHPTAGARIVLTAMPPPSPAWRRMLI